MNEMQEKFVKEKILSLLEDQEGKKITVIKEEKKEQVDKTA